jgi:hypothetical protein
MSWSLFLRQAGLTAASGFKNETVRTRKRPLHQKQGHIRGNFMWVIRDIVGAFLRLIDCFTCRKLQKLIPKLGP